MKRVVLFAIVLTAFAQFFAFAKDTTQTLTIFGDAGLLKVLNKNVGNFGLRIDYEDKNLGFLLSTYAKYGTGGGDTIRSGHKGIFANPFIANVGINVDLTYFPQVLSTNNLNLGFTIGYGSVGDIDQSNNLLWGYTAADQNPITRAYVQNVGLSYVNLGATFLFKYKSKDTNVKTVSIEINPRFSFKSLSNEISSNNPTVENLRNKSLEITNGQNSFSCLDIPVTIRIKSLVLKYNWVKFLNSNLSGSVSSVSFGFEDSLNF